MAGAFQTVRGPGRSVLVADFIFLKLGPERYELGTVWVGLMIVFAADLITLSWVGM